ncbi:hypothetical protein [Flavisphingomonas formosensis]|uniref:hypothetical protein n=1 Tax=Flavisphingomonas formosensis TaxID=861534 RepID=UPI0012F8DC14|nr:hypothetical protein [Sphingomonas formosensis]
MARDEGGQRVLACAHCDEVPSDYAGNDKSGLLEPIGPVTQLPGVRDPIVFLDDAIELRTYCCLGWLTQMTVDVMRAGEPVLGDVRLSAQTAA